MKSHTNHICLWFLLFYTVQGYGQGSVSWLTVSNDGADAPVFFWSGVGPTNLAPAGTLVQLLGRPVDSDEDYHIVRSIGGQTIMTIETPGFYSMKAMVDIYFVEGASGERVPAEFQLRGWRGAPTWEEAVNDPNAFIGESEVFINLTGAQQSLLSIPEPEDLMPPSFTIIPVPEPNTWALVLLGIGSWGLFLLSYKRRDSFCRRP